VDLFRASLMLDYVLSGPDAPVNYDYGGFLAVGVDLPLWEPEGGKQTEPAERPPPER